MKVLLDTNIILDIGLGRKPFVELAMRVLRTAQERGFGYLLIARSHPSFQPPGQQ